MFWVGGSQIPQESEDIRTVKKAVLVIRQVRMIRELLTHDPQTEEETRKFMDLEWGLLNLQNNMKMMDADVRIKEERIKELEHQLQLKMELGIVSSDDRDEQVNLPEPVAVTKKDDSHSDTTEIVISVCQGPSSIEDSFSSIMDTVIRNAAAAYENLSNEASRTTVNAHASKKEVAGYKLKPGREKKCPRCPRVFTSSTNLLNHIRVHSGERPFRCPTCGSRFNQQSNLTTHRRRLHDFQE